MYIHVECFHICGMWRNLFVSVVTAFAITGRLFIHELYIYNNSLFTPCEKKFHFLS